MTKAMMVWKSDYDEVRADLVRLIKAIDNEGWNIDVRGINEVLVPLIEKYKDKIDDATSEK